ncbi:MAG: glucose-1-phosphate thymidylyltransferase [Cytophagia bacterium]|nr:glucose-1-phosphate thymidylyltransferase [Cytophagia bacterium]
MLERKGIILAGGRGSRLHPITLGVCKQLLPVYDKPMIYYPLSTLMLAGIKEILVITNKDDQPNFKRLLSDGKHLGINIEYAIQSKPEGLAQAFTIGESFINKSPVALILGDNLFHGQDLISKLEKCNKTNTGAKLFAYPVRDPQNYGVAEFNKKGELINIVEKPKNPKTKYAITGIYFYDNSVIERAKNIKKSNRGEYEITDLNLSYLKDKKLSVELMGRGMAWLDTGNFESLHEASGYIRTLEHRQGLKVGCPEEIAWRKGWINNTDLSEIAKNLSKSGYGLYLNDIVSSFE